MDVGLYLRISEDRTGDELGISRQREDGEQLARLRGWTITREYVDNDLSAAGKKHRPGFEEAITDIEAGKISGLIAWDMTRVSRNRRDTVRLLEAGEKRRLVLAFVRGSDVDLSTPAGALTAEILASVARNEIRVKGERQRSAARQRVDAGLPVGGRRVFGYQADKVTLEATEAAALLRAYKDLLEGVPVAQLAADLNRAGLYTTQRRRDGSKSPSPWTAQTLGLALQNPRYCGLRATTVRPEKGRPTWEVHGMAVWAPVVTEDVWRAAQTILTDPTRRHHAVLGQALLTGLAACGVDGCGSLVHGGRNQLHQRTYRCRAANGHVVRQAEPIDQFIGQVVVQRLSQPDAAGLLVDETNPDVYAMRAELTAARIRLDSLAVEFADGDLTASQLRAVTKRLRTKITELEAKIADAGRVDVLGPLVAASDVQAAWDSLDVARRRLIVDVLMEVSILSVGRGVRTFQPGSVHIQWKN